jgi:hypothetical protein
MRSVKEDDRIRHQYFLCLGAEAVGAMGADQLAPKLELGFRK